MDGTRKGAKNGGTAINGPAGTDGTGLRRDHPSYSGFRSLQGGLGVGFEIGVKSKTIQRHLCIE